MKPSEPSQVTPDQLTLFDYVASALSEETDDRIPALGNSTRGSSGLDVPHRSGGRANTNGQAQRRFLAKIIEEALSLTRGDEFRGASAQSDCHRRQQ
jgi:hypothetical protein